MKDIKRKKLLGLISILDESIGNLTAKLKEENLYDDTLIYFLSDVILTLAAIHLLINNFDFFPKYKEWR